jgi:hypothetical protein
VGNLTLGTTAAGDNDAVVYFSDSQGVQSNDFRWNARDSRFETSADLRVRGTIDSVTKPMPLGVWRRQGAVMTAAAGQPDKVEEPVVIYEDNTFKMWYKEGGWRTTTAHINYATSSDGINWTSYAGNPVVNGGIRPAIIKKDGIYYLYVTDYILGGALSTQFKLYTSTDGINFTFDSIVLERGTTGEWDSLAIDNKFVWVEGTNDWKMLYEGYGPVGGINQYRTGLATSSDGKAWTKSGSNPVTNLTVGRGRPWVKKIGSYYYLWIHSGTLPMDIYRMRSLDLITWEEYPVAPVFVRQGDDEGEFSSNGQAVDPFLLEYDNKVYLYYCGQSDGTDASKNAYIKLAIADMTIEELVATNEDAESFYVDNVNKKVGIGTAAPLYKLSVDGTASISDNFYLANDMLWSSIANDTLYSSSSWQIGGNFDLDGTASISTLTINGAVYSNNGTLTNVNPSSEIYKHDINPLDLNAERLYGLQLKSFAWNNNNQLDFGLIAEDIKSILPEIYSEQNGIMGYKSDHLSFYLLELAQKQEKEIEGLKASLSLNALGMIETDIKSAFDETIINRISSLIKDVLEKLGLFIENGVASVKKLIADEAKINKLQVDRFEMKEKETGDIYCIWMEKGELQKQKGECSEIDNQPEPAQTATESVIEPSVEPENENSNTEPPIIESPSEEPIINPEPNPEPSIQE